MRRSVGFVLCILAALGLAPSVRAAQSLVTVLRPAEQDPLVEEAISRLAAELASAGFSPVVVGPVGSADPRTLVEESGSDPAAFARISIVRVGDGAALDVWIADRVTGKTVVRRIAPKHGKESARVLAIRAVELLHASLQEIETTSSEPTEQQAARVPPDIKHWVETSSPAVEQRGGGFFVVAGAALLTAPSFTTSAGPALGLGYQWSSSVGIRALFAGPMTGGGLSAGDTSASIRQELFLVEGTYAIGPGGWIVRPRVEGGMGVYGLSIDGTAPSPYFGKSDSAVGMAFDLGAGATIRLSQHAGLSIDGRAVVVSPRPVVALTNDRWPTGRPSVLGSAGLVVRF